MYVRARERIIGRVAFFRSDACGYHRRLVLQRDAFARMMIN